MRGFSKPTGETAQTRALSPAVAVGLLVVITVVLSMAAMAGVMVLSEDVSEPAPDAVLAADIGPDGGVVLEHLGGDTIDTDQLGFVGPVPEGQSFDKETLSAGEQITIDVLERGTGSVVWQADDGDMTTTLKQFEAPPQGNWSTLRTKLKNDENVTLQRDYTTKSPGYNQEVDSGSWDAIDYNGVLDGNGHSIRGINISSNTWKTGFIKELGEDGEVKNLNVIEPTITVTGGNPYTGFISIADGNVSNVHVKDADISVSGNEVAGLVGRNRGTIQDSSVTGTIEGTETVGGLVGRNYVGSSVGPGVIKNSYATATVSGEDAVGGLVGKQDGTSTNDDAMISESYATGAVSGTGGGTVGAIGGLVGKQVGGNISASYATGDASDPGTSTFQSGVGGLVGFNDGGGHISASYATGDVSGKIAGGLVGQHASGLVNASYATGTVTGSGVTGGLIAKVNNNYNPDTANSYWDEVSTGQASSANEGSGSTGFSTDSDGDGRADEMVGGAASSNMSAFDFNDVWDTASSPADYPVLQALDE